MKRIYFEFRSLERKGKATDHVNKICNLEWFDEFSPKNRLLTTTFFGGAKKVVSDPCDHAMASKERTSKE
jgi:hypothetical protein